MFGSATCRWSRRRWWNAVLVCVRRHSRTLRGSAGRKRAGGAARAGRTAERAVSVRLLGVPVDAGSLGHRSGFSHHAHRPAGRAARRGAPCWSISPAIPTARSTTTCPRTDRRFIDCTSCAKGEPYFLGIFLMGAYQDIMGDSHNLFGRVPEVHVYADAEEPGGYYVEKMIPGMAVQEMLAQVQYFPNDLHRRMSEQIRQKIESGKVRAKVGMRDARALHALLRDQHLLRSPGLRRRRDMKATRADQAPGRARADALRGGSADERRQGARDDARGGAARARRSCVCRSCSVRATSASPKMPGSSSWPSRCRDRPATPSSNSRPSSTSR